MLSIQKMICSGLLTSLRRGPRGALFGESLQCFDVMTGSEFAEHAFIQHVLDASLFTVDPHAPRRLAHRAPQRPVA